MGQLNCSWKDGDAVKNEKARWRKDSPPFILKMIVAGTTSARVGSHEGFSWLDVKGSRIRINRLGD